MKTLLVVMWLILSVSHTHAALLFEEEFETFPAGWKCTDSNGAIAGTVWNSYSAECQTLSNGLQHKRLVPGRVGNGLGVFYDQNISNGYSDMSRYISGSWGKTIYHRFYIKIDAGLNKAFAEGFKFWRYYAPNNTQEIYLNVKGGPTFSDGYLSAITTIAPRSGAAPNLVPISSIQGQPGPNGDGWHSVELRITLNSSAGASDGVLQAWHNGTLTYNETGIQWFSGLDPIHTPWPIRVGIGNVSDSLWYNTTPYGIYFDDYVIYDSTPPNTDASGNPFIGPIGWGTPAPPPDITAPTCTTFAVQATSQSLTVPITSWDCTDNTAVTGWYLSETPNAPGSTGWLSQKPTSFTVGGAGTRTIYAWVRDGADNRSVGRSSSSVVGEEQQSVGGGGGTVMGIRGRSIVSPTGQGRMIFQP